MNSSRVARAKLKIKVTAIILAIYYLIIVPIGMVIIEFGFDGESPWVNCVGTDMFEMSDTLDIDATNDQWVDTGITLATGSEYIININSGSIAMCGANEHKNIAVAANTSTQVPVSHGNVISPNSNITTTVHAPSSATGTQGSKVKVGSPADWDDTKSNDENVVCTSTVTTNCWDTYGNLYSQGGSLQAFFNGINPTSIATTEVAMGRKSWIAPSKINWTNIWLGVNGGNSSLTGGYTVDVLLERCYKTDGDGLIGTISSGNPNTTAPTSTFSLSGGVPRTSSTSEGNLWIKVNDILASDSDGNYNNNTKVDGSAYSYNISILTYNGSSTAATTSTWISDMMNSATSFLTTGLKDAREQMFKNFLDGGFQNTIHAALVLYIALYATAFTLGMIQTPQWDFILRIVKFAVILQLTTDGAWDFFNDNVFSLFTNGSSYLVHTLSNLQYGTVNANPWNPDNPISFSFLDNTVGQISTGQFWVKLISLSLTGPFGWLYLIILFIGTYYFVSAVIRAILMYLIAFLMVTILIAIAPIFLTCILFTQTKSLFDGWFKLLVMNSVKPILIFTTLAVLNYLMYATMARTFDYGACWKCITFLDFKLSYLPYFCIFHWWQPVAFESLSATPGVYLPIGFTEVVTYLIVGMLADKFVTFSEKMANTLVGAFHGRATLAGATGSSPTGTSPGRGMLKDFDKYGKGIVGMDAASKKRRATAKSISRSQEKAAKQEEKKEARDAKKQAKATDAAKKATDPKSVAEKAQQKQAEELANTADPLAAARAKPLPPTPTVPAGDSASGSKPDVPAKSSPRTKPLNVPPKVNRADDDSSDSSSDDSSDASADS